MIFIYTVYYKQNYSAKSSHDNNVEIIVYMKIIVDDFAL